MKEQEISDFLDKNKEAFKVLKQKIKSIDTVKGIATLHDIRGRQDAIRIINSWLIELWGISYPELPEPDEEDDIFRIIERPKANS